MKKLWEKEVSRRKLLGGVAATGAAIPVLHELVPHAGLHDSSARAQAVHEGHKVNDASGHLGAVGKVDPKANGFDPQEILRDFDTGHAAQRRARMGDRGRGPRDRGGPRGQVRGLDLQRARARAHAAGAARASGCASASPTRSSHPHTMHFHGIHRDVMRRHPRHRRRQHRARASRRTTSSTPRPSASTSTTATRPRWRSTSPRGSTARSSSTPRTPASPPTSS